LAAATRPTRQIKAKFQAKRGYGGYVAKDEASVYEAGPTRRWLKVKQKDWTVAEDRWRWRISTT
jgi:ATP-dependent DNA ligase